MRNGIIFTGGDYPIGSSARRIKLWHDGLLKNNINTKVLIVYPSPSIFDKENAEDFVHFMLPPKNLKSSVSLKHIRTFGTIYNKFIGAFKGYIFIKEQKNIEFIFLYGIDFFSGLFAMITASKRKLKIYIERTDENRRMFNTNKSIWDYLGSLNEILFDKFILKKADYLFTVSEYLEIKYRNKFPLLRIKRSIPSFIDMENYILDSKNNLSEIQDIDLSVFNSSLPLIMFSGSCIYTNGLEFFIKSASKLQKDNIDFRIVFLFFKGNVQYIKSLLHINGLEKITTIYENILPKYIPAFYKRADVLVLPEMGDVVANAGFPGKSAEYLASGKAIICTDFSNLKDIFINNYNCMMSARGNEVDYQNNLKQLLLNESLRTELGRNAKLTAISSFDYKQGVLPLVDAIYDN